MRLRRVLLVYKKSSYQLYAQERGDDSLARALARNDKAAQRILNGHETQMAAGRPGGKNFATGQNRVPQQLARQGTLDAWL
jgi:hypothetical protein